ncbi:hypothetical protein ACFWU5_18320 [Nocardia sp. NPDC058640]|uniref:hypothetical protein n=1 Tax=Nocardia sp. NPDC058640 TaxID=3346571 RepID=UPI003651BA30
MGVPGGGENTHSWRHHEIVAAFQSLDVTDAVAQADKFDQIARDWEAAVRTFQHAVGGLLPQVWEGVAAAAAGSAIDAYVRQARELTVALEELPGIVRAAAEAIVATKYAIGSPSTQVSAGMGSEWPANGAVREADSTLSAAEEDARAAMRQRYVVPFGELIGRIPLLPTPLRTVDGGSEVGDRQLLIDIVGQSRSERRAQSRGGIEVPVDDSGATKVDGRVTGVPTESSDEVIDRSEGIGNSSGGAADWSAGPDHGAAQSSGTVAPMSTATTVTTYPGGTAAPPIPGGTGFHTAPTSTFAATIDPATVTAGRGPSPSSAGARSDHGVGMSAARDRTPGGRNHPLPGRQDGPRAGHSVAGSVSPVIGAGPPVGHASTRSVDRFFHCAGAPVTQSSPSIETERGLPQYLITQANTEELLGVALPAVAGGVIGGGADLLPGEQCSPVTRG